VPCDWERWRSRHVKHTKSARGGAGVAGRLSAGRRRGQLQDDGDKRGGMECGCREGSGRALAMWSCYAVQVDSVRPSGLQPRHATARQGGISIWQPGSGRGMPLQVLRPACPACNGANEWIKSVGAAAARALTAPAPFHLFTFVLVLLVFARCLFVYSLPVPPNTALPRLAPTPPPTVHHPNPLPTLSPSSNICICSGAGTCTYPHLDTATTRPP
jgi:hypothetical protein